MKLTTARTALFGPYALDLRSGELRKLGIKVKMGEQAFQILCMLLENPGEMVTREELRAMLWANDTFVDFDHGLNSAVQRLRDSLSDSAVNPRWVETLPRRGYRFVGQVEWSDEGIPSDLLTKPGGERRDETSVLAETRPAETDSPALRDETSASRRPARLPSPGLTGPYLRAIRQRWRLALAVMVLCLAAAAVLEVKTGGVLDRLFSTNHPPQIRSIAVLSLSNLSGDASQDYFADGMTDEVTTMLAKNTSLRVISRTSAMHYRGANRPLREIARELGVDGILEGSISRTPNHVHMNVQLIYAPTDSHIWAESYDRDSTQAQALPAELSQTIAKLVRVAASPPPATRYINPEAHDAYLRGRYLWFGGNDVRSQEFYEKALQMQPDYAAAWSGLADTYATSGMGEHPPSEVAHKVEAAARKGLELDDSLAEAHHSMAAWYFFYAWDLQHAEIESKRAIDLNPNFSEAHHLLSYILLAMNQPDGALREQVRATELDPFARPTTLGRLYLHLRRFDEALSELRLRAEGSPDDARIHLVLSVAYWHKGMWKESEQELEKGMQLSDSKDNAQALHRAFERGGEKAVERWQVEDLKAKARANYVSPLNLATLCAYLGDKNETLKYLEEAYRVRDPKLIMLQTEPVFDPFHSEPRYRNLIRMMGLPERI